MSDYHFIYNPNAGHGTAERAFEKMKKLLEQRGVDYSIARSEYSGHAITLALEAIAAGHKHIVAAGGDGTVREVASVVHNTDTPMCIFPCGTGNDIARVFNISTDPAKALDVMLNGKSQKVDAATANGLFFLNVGGMGFDVDVLENMERYKKRFKGLTAYILGLLHSLFSLKLHKVSITHNGETKHYNALLVAAANGTHYGGGMNIAPLADPTDGLLDVCILSNVTVFTVLSTLTRFVSGKHLSLPITTYYKAKEITVESDSRLEAQLDGEIMGITPITFKILPKVLNIILA